MSENQSSSKQEAPVSGRASPFYFAAWRWHFYAGIFVVPFLLTLAATGMTMMYIAYFGGRDGERIVVDVPPSGQMVSIQSQSAAALEAAPGGTIVEWLKGQADNNVSVFRISTDAGTKMVAVDPYKGTVVDTWDRRAGWYDFADNLHSDLMLGVTGDRMLEIAAGLSVILLVTGIYLWWPRGTGLVRSIVPDLSKPGRPLWKSLHTTIGVVFAPFLILFLLTGHSWTGVWGSKLMQAWNTFPAEKWDNVPLSDLTHASLNDGVRSDVPWALEQTQLPASGSTGGVVGIAPGVKVDIDSVAALANAVGLERRYRISYPQSETGVWTINQDTMSGDAQSPTADRTMHVDQYTGRILANVGFEDYSLAGKMMAVGTPFHMGLMGLWNLVLNTAICLSVMFLCVTGVVMWWIRRPKKTSARIFAPKVPGNLPHWPAAMLIMLFLSLFFPLVGITLISVITLDLLVLSRVPVLRRAFA
ncbi:MAG: PepSY domain-containing protein [Rhodobacteraceae bacterium]|nr:PepSY domain-containing protein [Paracoccaceae bacterium]